MNTISQRILEVAERLGSHRDITALHQIASDISVVIEVLTVERIKHHLDSRLNSHLVDMREGFDDSVVGFNEAWDVMREFFKGIAEEDGSKLRFPTAHRDAETVWLHFKTKTGREALIDLETIAQKTSGMIGNIILEWCKEVP